jgi:hypothetical protein
MDTFSRLFRRIFSDTYKSTDKLNNKILTRSISSSTNYIGKSDIYNVDSFNKIVISKNYVEIHDVGVFSFLNFAVNVYSPISDWVAKYYLWFFGIESGKEPLISNLRKVSCLEKLIWLFISKNNGFYLEVYCLECMKSY